jgi:hypothetical protein
MTNEAKGEFPTRQTMDRYNRLTLDWDIDGLIDMWAEDGVMKLIPLELGEFRGIKEIETHYRARPSTRPFDIRIERLVTEGTDGFVEVRGEIIGSGAEFHVVDQVTVRPGDGKIQSVTGFVRIFPALDEVMPQ